MEKDPNIALSTIERAKSEALTFEELEHVKNQIDAMTADFLKGNINLATYREVEKLELYPGSIEIETVKGFEEALREIGLDEETVLEFLEHEGEHFREIENAGLKALYRIEFLRKEDGGYAMYPAVSFNFPPDITDENARDLLKKVIGAASDPSERDINQLNKV